MITNTYWNKACRLYPQHAARIRRGRSIFEAHCADPRQGLICAVAWPNGVQPAPLTFIVRSQSDPAVTYDVDAGGCTCPDWPTSRRCKHYIAVATLCRAAGLTLGAPAGEATSPASARPGASKGENA